MNFSSKIIGLEGDLRTLITRWDRFFVGSLKLPPTREKEVLRRRLRALAESSSEAHSGDRFRLDQLQHRFMVYATNWERMLRESEEGVRRYIPGKKNRDGAAVVPPRPQQATTNDRPVTSVDESDADDLFKLWCAAKAEIGQEVKIGRQAFEAQIDRQRRDVEARLDSKVAFSVSVADGKVKLTARRTGKSDDEE